MTRRGSIQTRLISLTLGVGLWESASYSVGSRYFPRIWTVLKDLGSLINSLSFWKSYIETLALSFAGFTIGSIAAFFFALLIVTVRSGDSSTRLILNFLRSMPSVVLLPLLVASIGSSARTAVILSTIVVTFKVITFFVRGLQSAETQLVDVAQVLSLPQRNRLAYLYIPSTLIFAGTGLRLSASRAFGTVVAAGIVAGTPGLGSGLLMAESAANIPRVFSFVLVMGLTGMGIYNLFLRVESSLTPWRASA